MPLYPEVLRTKERTPTPSPFVVFTFGFAIESIKDQLMDQDELKSA
jgi:hypothetical protein